MPQVTINATDYDVYADVAYADAYLAADIARATAWAALSAGDTKKQALVSATRTLQRMTGWVDGMAPEIDSAITAVQDATSVLAADMAAKPKLSKSAGTSSNIKRTKAGSAEVEFFRQSDDTTLPIPEDAFNILLAAGLVTAPSAGDDPYYSGGDVETRFTYDEATGTYC